MNPPEKERARRDEITNQSRSIILADKRILTFICLCTLLTILFIRPLSELVRYSLKEEIHSHILLIPFVSIYLACISKKSIPPQRSTSLVGAVVLAAIGLLVYLMPIIRGHVISANDDLTRWAAIYVILIGATGFACLGNGMMKTLAFPFAFLVFMIPLPTSVIFGLEQLLMRWSADVSYWFFMWTGTPVYRDGQVLELPGTILHVAPECSGIRSSLVLFITSIVASYLLLQSRVHRLILVLLVIPLGIIRNGLRVLVIGLLCVHQGPHMIDSWVHHKGGPIFFGLSLIPMLLIVLWFHRREAASNTAKRQNNVTDNCSLNY